MEYIICVIGGLLVGWFLKSTSVGTKQIEKLCTPFKAMTPDTGNEEANNVVRYLHERANVVFGNDLVMKDDSYWQVIDFMKKDGILDEIGMTEDDAAKLLSYGNDFVEPGAHWLSNFVRLCYTLGVKITFEQFEWEDRHNSGCVSIEPSRATLRGHNEALHNHVRQLEANLKKMSEECNALKQAILRETFE